MSYKPSRVAESSVHFRSSPRILILRGGALGDFVVTLPALGLLRAHWPDSRIELVGNAVAAQLAVDRHYLDAAHAQDDARWSRIGRGDLERDAAMSAWLRTFDLVINYWPDRDGAIAADFARIGFSSIGTDSDCRVDRGIREDAIRRRWFITHPAHPSVGPAAAHYCAALAPLGLQTRDFATPLRPSPADHEAATALLPATEQPRVAWHPGSGSPGKIWPREKWRDVLRSLPSHQLVVVSGPAEEPLEDFPADGILLRQVPPPVLAAVFTRCALFLGHDSGPAHVAAATGCPCVVVFGPTDPAIWAPPYPHVTALRAGCRTEDTRAADVRAAANAILSHPYPVGPARPAAASPG